MAATPLAWDGFDADLYVSGSVLGGASPEVPGFSGAWAGASGASAAGGSLIYAGIGEAGANRVVLTGSTTVARQFASGPSEPLANYIDASGDVSLSQNGTPLYFSFLMQVDGASPPTSTFSLYNGGVASADRVFRVLASPSNSHFQAIVGPSGAAVNLGPMNAGVNLFVVRVDFAPGGDVIRVWQNPTSGQPETAPDAQLPLYNLAFDRVAFSRFGGVGSAQFDELRFGDTWGAVTSQNALALLPRAPISAEGFAPLDYPGGALAGTWSYVTAYDGPWNVAGLASVPAGSLGYAGIGQSGANRVVLEGNTVASRELLTSNNGPLANYVGSSGSIEGSQNDAPLYVSFLMRVDGVTPPTATFSLYDGGVASSDRVFRVLSSPSNTHFQAIVGPSGEGVDLGPLSAGVNLFVVRIDFAPEGDLISVWQNPTAAEPETAPDAQLPLDGLAFDRVAFTRFGGDGSAQFDELRLGDSWSAVTSQEALALLPPPRNIFGVQEAPPSPLGGGLYPDGFFPFIDAFGQYRYLEWDEKVHSLADLTQAATDEALGLAANPSPGDLNEYGGWLAGPQLDATGFFRVEKVDGKWWLVDPSGRLFFSNGITGVSDPDREGTAGVAVKTPVSGREDYFAELPQAGDPAAEFLSFETSTVTSGDYQGQRPLTMNFFAANAQTKYGEDWEAQTQAIAHERLRSWGMNTIGAWSDEDVYLQAKTPYTLVLFPANPSLINGDGRFADYFDPAYRANVEARLLEESGKSLNDPWNLGYFIHNELDWTRGGLTTDNDLGLQTLAAVSTQPAKAAFRDQLTAKYGTIGALNAQWLTSYTSWNDFLVQRSVVPDLTRSAADLFEFDALYAETYFAATAAAMDTVAPNHLYLGARFTGAARFSAAQAAMRHADVVSINRYGNDVSVLPPGLVGDVPLISGEYHFSANDTGLWSDGLRTAADQAARADQFAAYVSSALENDRYVGVHWLQYWDFPSSGKLNSNNNNSNLGFVTIADTPYGEMVESARTIGADLYETRVGDFAFVSDGVLYITGTQAADQIQVSANADSILVDRNGSLREIAQDEVSGLQISGGLQADIVTLSGLGKLSVTVRNDVPGDAVLLTGDYNGDAAVDQADYVLWKSAFGGADLRADGNNDGVVDAADYSVWRDNLGAPWTPAAQPAVVPPLAPVAAAALAEAFADEYSGLLNLAGDGQAINAALPPPRRSAPTLLVAQHTGSLPEPAPAPAAAETASHADRPVGSARHGAEEPIATSASNGANRGVRGLPGAFCWLDVLGSKHSACG